MMSKQTKDTDSLLNATCSNSSPFRHGICIRFGKLEYPMRSLPSRTIDGPVNASNVGVTPGSLQSRMSRPASCCALRQQRYWNAIFRHGLSSPLEVQSHTHTPFKLCLTSIVGLIRISRAVCIWDWFWETLESNIFSCQADVDINWVTTFRVRVVFRGLDG